METEANFIIQTTYDKNRSNWEPVENAEYETLADAEAGMEDLEQNLGWRGMRIVDSEGYVCVDGLEDEDEDA